MLLSFAIRARGSIIPDPETHYTDINSGKPLEIVKFTDNHIKITTPVGLYQNCNKKYLFVTFNPNHTKESVYVKDKTLRDYYTQTKYVHQDVIQSDIWDLGIDDPEVKYIIARLITIRMPFEDRRCAINVARFCSKFISYVDGSQFQGLIQDYPQSDQGKLSIWTSTKEVLSEYIRLNKDRKCTPPSGLQDTLPKAVKYGQCFVFACVFQSFMRSFGIPCRCIVNTKSLHDIIRDVVITTKEGDENISSKAKFHVWNEVWLNRSDSLYKNFGWQIIDTTPQGLSSSDIDVKQISHGPCPLKAIYDIVSESETDVKSICGEINAINVIYLIRRDNRYIYDITYRRNSNDIMGECHDGQPNIKISPNGKKNLIYPLSSVRSSYINDKLNPISRLFEKREYLSRVRFDHILSSYPSVFNFEVSLRSEIPSKRLTDYEVIVLGSLERESISYEANEINSKTLRVYHGKKENSKWIFNLPNNLFTKDLYMGCKLDHDHTKCKTPTLRIIIQKKNSEATVSQIKIYLYQYIIQGHKSQWMNKSAVV